MNPLYDQVGIGKDAYKRGDWQRIAIHSETHIHGFFGPFRFLSNMWPVEVHFEGAVYPSVENAYQAAKFAPENRVDYLSCTPKDAKKFADSRAMQYSPSEWNAKRDGVMRALLEEKFDPVLNPELSAKLKATGARDLEETNWWRDTYWGVCEGKGENILGNMLMKIRATL